MIGTYLKKLKPYLSFRNYVIIFLFLLPILITLVFFFTGSDDEFSRMGNAVYSPDAIQARCEPGARPGDAGASYGESTAEGIKYNIRTPLNYDPSIGHPLLLVYSPAGSNRAKTEKNTGLTFDATRAGFIVAYADHPELSPTTTIELGTIPELVAKKWCIDEKRIYITGHSDGGTAAMALAFMTGTAHIPTAIAPSAAGINYEDLRDRTCPEPLPVMVMHSAKDRLFPNYGLESSGWWAACNQCDPIPEKLSNGCIAYSNCAKAVKTWYCEGDKPHAQWPGLNSTLIEFFVSAGRGSR